MDTQYSDARLLAQAFGLDQQASKALDSLMCGQVTPLSEKVREKLQHLGIVFVPVQQPCFVLAPEGMESIENRYANWIDRAA